MTVRTGRVDVCPEPAGHDYELGCKSLGSGTERPPPCADLHDAEDPTCLLEMDHLYSHLDLTTIFTSKSTECFL